MALWTTVGRNLVASAVQSTAGVCAITYVGISLGCGTLSAGLTAGNTYTALPLDGTLAVALGSGQSLTITDGTNSQTVTTNGTSSIGAGSITVVSFTALNNYTAHVTGVCPTPLASDLALPGTAGAGAGESFSQGYFDGTQATGIYLMVGYFGGSSASSSVATGTLMGEDIQFWNHTVNADSNMYQADSVV